MPGKKITIKDATLEKKISFMCKIQGWTLSPSETNLLISLIKFGSMQINIDSKVSQELREDSGLNEGTFNTLLPRLAVKGCIKKENRVIFIHPALGGIRECNEYLVAFVE